MQHLQNLTELAAKIDERLAADPKWIKDDRAALVALAEMIAAWLAMFDELEADLKAKFEATAAQLTAKKDELAQLLADDAAALGAELTADLTEKAGELATELETAKNNALDEVEAEKDISVQAVQTAQDAAVQAVQTAQDAAEIFIDNEVNDRVKELQTAKTEAINEAFNEIATYVKTNKTNLQGEKGDKGDTGAQGPKGDKGDTGAAGAQGPKGEKGEKGDKGDKGEKGDKGDKGDTGATGAAGSDADATAAIAELKANLAAKITQLQSSLATQRDAITALNTRVSELSASANPTTTISATDVNFGFEVIDGISMPLSCCTPNENSTVTKTITITADRDLTGASVKCEQGGTFESVFKDVFNDGHGDSSYAKDVNKSNGYNFSHAINGKTITLTFTSAGAEYIYEAYDRDEREFYFVSASVTVLNSTVTIITTDNKAIIYNIKVGSW